VAGRRDPDPRAAADLAGLPAEHHQRIEAGRRVRPLDPDATGEARRDASVPPRLAIVIVIVGIVRATLVPLLVVRSAGPAILVGDTARHRLLRRHLAQRA